jgi:hypothetical protein
MKILLQISIFIFKFFDQGCLNNYLKLKYDLIVLCEITFLKLNLKSLNL